MIRNYDRAAALLAMALLAPISAAPALAAPPAPASAATQDAALATFLDAAFDQAVALSPETEASLGIARDQDRLDDRSEAGLKRALVLLEQQGREMARRFPPATLSANGQLNYRLFEDKVFRARELYRWRYYIAPASIDGGADEALTFLANRHGIATRADADNYIARLNAIEPFLATLASRIDAQRSKGIFPTAAQIDRLRVSANAYVAGAPFTPGADGPLLGDFRGKLDKSGVAMTDREALIAEARAALTGPVKRGYDRYMAALDRVAPQARKDVGVWSLPGGDAYYAAALRRWNDTDLSADAVHRIGLDHVAAIKREMEVVMRQVGFTGTVREFFEHVRNDPRFKYTNDDAGRARYLADATATVKSALAAAPRFFDHIPKAPIEVRAVEKWREANAAVAFYDPASPDGGRPGVFYINLADMAQVQKIQMPAITFHEAVPGHHFQIALAQEAGELPKFRRFDLSYGSYAEGWGLYSERLADEMGLYSDPYARFGMLSLQLWRACRLVLDTGIHAKRWTRDQAIAFFRENSPLSQRDIEREVDRYIGSPGQATAYMIGQDRIDGLRRRATEQLGSQFRIGEFHNTVLRNGGLPWRLLDEQVDRWIAETRSRKAQ